MAFSLKQTISSDMKVHKKNRSEHDVPARPGVQRFTACIWLADNVEKETKEVSKSLLWSHVFGTRINQAIYFVKSRDRYSYLAPYTPVYVTLEETNQKHLIVRGFRLDDPTLPELEVEQKRIHVSTVYSSIGSDDIDSTSLSPDKVTIEIQHPCNLIEHTWQTWKLEQNTLLQFIAELVSKLKVYGDDLVALNVCIDGTRMQIDPKKSKTMRESGFNPPVQAWVYREQRSTLETGDMLTAARALQGEDMDTSSEEDLSIAEAEVEDDKLTLRRSKAPPKAKPQPKPTKQDLRLYLRLPTEEKVMEVVNPMTTIKQLKSLLCEQEGLDPRAKITISFEKAKLPDEITVQGAQLANNAILDVAYN